MTDKTADNKKDERQNTNSKLYTEGGNWTQEIKYVIPVPTPEPKMGYEKLTLVQGGGKKDKAWWKFFSHTSAKYHFQVRKTPDFELPAISESFSTKDFHKVQEKTQMSFVVCVSTKDSEKVAKSFPDDPIRKIVKKMLRQVQKDSENIDSTQTLQHKDAWEKRLPSIGSENDFGIEVKSVEIKIELPIKSILISRKKFQLKWNAYERADKLREEKFKADQEEQLLKQKKRIGAVESEEKKDAIRREQEELALKEELEGERNSAKQIREKETQAKLTKIDSDIKKLQSKTELEIEDESGMQNMKHEFVQVNIHKYNRGEITYDELINIIDKRNELSRGVTGSVQDHELLDNSGLKLIDVKVNHDQRNDPWHAIPLQTRRLPVDASVFIPQDIELGEKKSIIVELVRQDDFDNGKHHKMAKSCSTKLMNPELLAEKDKQYVRQFVFNKKENSYRCVFEVCWNQISNKPIKVIIVDEDEDVIGSASVKPIYI